MIIELYNIMTNGPNMQEERLMSNTSSSRITSLTDEVDLDLVMDDGLDIEMDDDHNLEKPNSTLKMRWFKDRISRSKSTT